METKFNYFFICCGNRLLCITTYSLHIYREAVGLYFFNITLCNTLRVRNKSENISSLSFWADRQIQNTNEGTCTLWQAIHSYEHSSDNVKHSKICPRSHLHQFLPVRHCMSSKIFTYSFEFQLTFSFVNFSLTLGPWAIFLYQKITQDQLVHFFGP